MSNEASGKNLEYVMWFHDSQRKAVVTDGASRATSMALTAVREMPARRASSSWDQPRRVLNSRTRFESIGFAMIVSS